MCNSSHSFKIFYDEYRGYFPLFLLSRSEYRSIFLKQKTLKINVQFCIFIFIFLEIKEIKKLFSTERWSVFSDFILL